MSDFDDGDEGAFLSDDVEFEVSESDVSPEQFVVIVEEVLGDGLFSASSDGGCMRAAARSAVSMSWRGHG